MKCPRQKECEDYLPRNFCCEEDAEWCTKSGIKKSNVGNVAFENPEKDYEPKEEIK
jgi:hypothetical protein